MRAEIVIVADDSSYRARVIRECVSIAGCRRAATAAYRRMDRRMDSRYGVEIWGGNLTLTVDGSVIDAYRVGYSTSEQVDAMED